MCGIVGYSWSDSCTLTVDQKRSLLLVGSVGADKRGGQSYGWLVADKAGPIVKRDLGPLVSADFNYLSNTQMGYLHSRFATQGTVTIENCHPFEIGSLIGAHNGVLSNSMELDSKYGDKAVDSEHIFHRIVEDNDISSIRGYGIIEYLDKAYPNRIYLVNIGNGSCSLFEIWDDTDKYCEGYYWTSLAEDGQLALAAAGIKNFEEYTLKEGHVYYFERGSDQLWVMENLEYKVGSSNNSYSGVWTTGSHRIDFNEFKGMNEWDQKDEDLKSEYPSLRELAITSDEEMWENYKSAKGLDFSDEAEEQEFREVMSSYLDEDMEAIKKVVG